MKSRSRILCIAAAIFFSASAVVAQHDSLAPTAGSKILWEIGKPDNAVNEFISVPGHEEPTQKDGFFVVGRSLSVKSWPFTHPGQDDSWAGGRQHTFSVWFGLARPAERATYRMLVKLISTGPSDVAVDVAVNGKMHHRTLSAGNDRSIRESISKGKREAFIISIPSGELLAGDNRIEISNVSGSWFIYDWIGFESPSETRTTPVKRQIVLGNSRSLPLLSETNGRRWQPVALQVVNTGDSTPATLSIKGFPDQTVGVAGGNSEVEFNAPAVSSDSTVQFTVHATGSQLLSGQVKLQPVKPMTVYILPHSHNDIGYTEIQGNVEKKQINNLITGIAYARQTKGYPAGARFVWNLEGTYAADLYLHRLNNDQKIAFLQAVKDGGVALNGMYVNTLTGLCRPEELLQLFRYSNELASLCDTSIQSAMISDVPGYTWGTVTAMAQAGIRYFSAAPNNFDRIGDILEQWEDKPFWWVAPSGKEKVLVWIPYRGYSLSHGLPNGLSKDFVLSYLSKLKQKGFNYDISYIRWSGHGDNAVPDLSICEFVKSWNEKYTSPRFVISSTTTAFRAFETRYGAQLPEQRGDWTGYWEDGAGSSAFETAENRNTSARLTQAQGLWAMTQPDVFPADSFRRAWQQVLLYSEHTWGADESVTRPLSQKTMEQWVVKKSYATTADSLSETLMESALDSQGGDVGQNAIDVFNSNSWDRTQLIRIPALLSAAGDVVKDQQGKRVISQRLSTGELAFVATNIPAFASGRYFISAGQPSNTTPLQADKHGADNGIIRFVIDSSSGAITSLRNKNIDNEFVDSTSGQGVNDYLFLPGNNLADLKRVNQVTVTIKESGPVITTLSIHSQAPGCNQLTRELSLIRNQDYLELVNILDKMPAELDPYPGNYAWANTKGKESLHIAFPFHVAGGIMKLDIPLAMMRPETDQIAGSCKNWLEVGGWADVSNKTLGITWVTLDAPLIEVGDITARLLGGQTNPAIWRKHIEPTQRFYSWALNNHWETNYRAYQEGKIVFRYSMKPHGPFDPAEAARLSTGLAQPLIVHPAKGKGLSVSLLRLSSPQVMVIALKPSSDAKAIIVSLFNPGESAATTSVNWKTPMGQTFVSNTAEKQIKAVTDKVIIEPQEVLTLRVENK